MLWLEFAFQISPPLGLVIVIVGATWIVKAELLTSATVVSTLLRTRTFAELVDVFGTVQANVAGLDATLAVTWVQLVPLFVE